MHEHLDEFRLINMNGRIYDPKLGRFLSPDPYGGATAGNTQNLNRYSYVLNNPLKYTDPSGYLERYRFWDGKNGGGASHNSSPVVFMNTSFTMGIVGPIGPGSGNHWSDPYRSQDGNFMLMSSSNFENFYGEGSFTEYLEGYGYIPSNSDGSSGITYEGNQARDMFIQILDALNNGLNITVMQAYGRNTVVASEGDIGVYSFGSTGGISFSNPTAGVFIPETTVEGASSQGGTWDPITNERISQLHPDVQGPAINFINQVELDLGIKLRVTQGLRTFAEQDALYAIGRTAPGFIVTNAKGGQSYHNYGLALDVVEIRNGKAIWNTNWSGISRIGINNGFEWGGNFRSISDKPHFQMTFGYSISDLLNLYNTGQW
jgi:RHS repeat-associated protein